MKCSNCKAEWTVPSGISITRCPFCNSPVMTVEGVSGDNEPHEVLLRIVQQYGISILSESRLKGFLSDYLSASEKKYYRIFKQAIDDQVVSKLLVLAGDEDSVKVLKINALKTAFKEHNGFDNTANYVVDCFLYALGWISSISKGQTGREGINKAEIIGPQIEMAFADGKLCREEAKALYKMADSIGYDEGELSKKIQRKISDLKLNLNTALSKPVILTREIICSREWVGSPVSASSVKVEKVDYETVKIGKQVWMKHNLNVDKFRNGDSIPQAENDDEWIKAGKREAPAWCLQNNDKENDKIYGKMYNWYAVNDPRGLAPEGFHVPSDNEWKELRDYCGGYDVAGSNLKTDYGWVIKNSWDHVDKGHDTYGFRGLAGGFRRADGDLPGLSYSSAWWSSTEGRTGCACCTYMVSWANSLRSDDSCKGEGNYVRCVRD